MKNFLYLLVCCFSFQLYSQKQKVVYEVDGIFVEAVFLKELKDLSEEEIYAVKEITNPEKIELLGYTNAKALIKITTQKYANRPDSLKRIPSSKQMQKIKGKWHLKNRPNPYSGKFRDYYINGTLKGKGSFENGVLDGERWLYFKDGAVSEKMHYKDGFPDGKEIRFYEDGTTKQIGFYRNGYEVGEWKKFHPNGVLKQVSQFNKDGVLNGEVITYYSTGELKGKSNFVNGELVESKTEKKLQEKYKEGEQLFQLAKFEKAITLFTKCIEEKPTWNDAYFARGTAYLNANQFEKALADFDQAIAIEPLDAYAYTNRAFTLIRKKEFENANKDGLNSDLKIFGSSKIETDTETLNQICEDLQNAKKLGDDSRMLLDTYYQYCK